MNGIQLKKQAGQQLNKLLYAVVIVIKYKKSIIDHAIYIKVFYYRTVSYLTVSIDDFINTTNNKTSFPEQRRILEEVLEIKVQEGSVLKYLNIRISSLLLVSVLIRLITSWKW